MAVLPWSSLPDGLEMKKQPLVWEDFSRLIPLFMLWLCMMRGGGVQKFPHPAERKVNCFSLSQTLGIRPGHQNLQVRDSPRPPFPETVCVLGVYVANLQALSSKKVGNHADKLFYWQTWMTGGTDSITGGKSWFLKWKDKMFPSFPSPPPIQPESVCERTLGLNGCGIYLSWSREEFLVHGTW